MSHLRGPSWCVIAALLFAVAACRADQREERELVPEVSTREQRVEAIFDDVRSDPAQLRALTARMPKGADLHVHLTGAVAPETYFQWGRALDNPTNVLCTGDDGTVYHSLYNRPCGYMGHSGAPLAAIAEGSARHQSLMRDWTLAGVLETPIAERAFDFYDLRRKYDLILTTYPFASLLGLALRDAGHHRLQHLEAILDLGASAGGPFGTAHLPAGEPWTDEYLAAKHAELLADPGFVAAVEAKARSAAKEVSSARDWLGCRNGATPLGCEVEVRLLVQVERDLAPAAVFGQAVLAYELAQREPTIGGVSLIKAENDATALENHDPVLLALGVLQRLYRDDPVLKPVHLSIHAGQLSAAALPPGAEGQRHLTFHIRRAVELGLADRIAHGTDVREESEGAGADALLEELRARGVLVELALASDQQLLGVSGDEHPLSAYRDHRVPISLVTDAPDVFRTDLSAEYARGVEEHGLGYLALKASARASLEHSFLDGANLWATPGGTTPIAACARDALGAEVPGPDCAAFLAANRRAAVQWELERRLAAFEAELAP